MIIHEVIQRSDAWYALRAGMPTASEFSNIVTSTGEPSKSRGKYARQLAAELYAGGPVDRWRGNADTEHGRTTEEEALSFYEFHRDVQLERVGFITDDAVTYGCSPDALVGEYGMVEVKCLIADKMVEAWQYFRKHGHAQPDYIQQTQGQIWVAERRWCDLIFYNPALPPLIIRQEPIIPVVAGIAAGIKEVIAERDSLVAMLKAA